MSLNKLTAVLSIAISTLTATTANSAGLTGTISTESGKPVMGAMLSVWNEDKTRKETVYTYGDILHGVGKVKQTCPHLQAAAKIGANGIGTFCIGID
ncbi:MAG TPA: hypothetical protein ENI05_05650, partial [Porticoccus sp.]|nr:hypothetical protein [Porticoccus sp.]